MLRPLLPIAVLVAAALSGCGEQPQVFTQLQWEKTVTPYTPGKGKSEQYNFLIAGLNPNGKTIKVTSAKTKGAGKFPSKLFLVPVKLGGREVCPNFTVRGPIKCPQANPLQGATITARSGDQYEVVGSISVPNYRSLAKPKDKAGYTTIGPWSISGATITYTLDGKTHTEQIDADREVSGKKLKMPVEWNQPTPPQ